MGDGKQSRVLGGGPGLAGLELCLGLSFWEGSLPLPERQVTTPRLQREPCVAGCLPESSLTLTFTLSSVPSEVNRTLPSLESLQRLFDQQLSPGLRPRPQVNTLGLER